MNQSQRLIYNAFIIWGMRILRHFPVIFLLPFVINRIGDEAYGIFVLIWSVIIALDKLESPITSSIVKFNASYLAENKKEKTNQLISTVFISSTFIALLIIAVIISIITFYPQTLKLSDSDVYVSAFTIIGIVIFFAAPMTSYVGIIYSLQRHDLFFIADTITTYLKVALIVIIFTVFQPSLNALIVISGLTYIAPRLAMMIIANRRLPSIKNKFRYFNWSIFREIFAFSGILIIASVCYIINFSGLIWLMGTIVSFQFLAHLEIILVPSRIIAQIILSMTLSVMPVASKYSTLKDREKLSELFIRGTRYITLILIPVVISAFLTMEPVINLWLGKKYIFLTSYILVVISFRALSMTSQCANQMLRGMGEVKKVLLCSVISQAILPLGVTVLVFKYCNDPYWAVSTGLSSGFTAYLMLQVYFCRKVLDVPFLQLIIGAYLQPLLIAIPLFMASKFIVIYLEVHNIIYLFALSLLANILFAVCFSIFFATEKEKKLVGNIIKSFQINHWLMRKNIA